MGRDLRGGWEAARFFVARREQFRETARVLGGTWPVLQVFLIRRTGDLTTRQGRTPKITPNYFGQERAIFPTV
jgi:hypothetical protein